MLLRFGRLQGQLAQTARYLKYVEPDREDGYGRWTTISFQQLVAENPGKFAKGSGVLEVLGIMGSMHWAGFKTPGVLTEECWASFYRRRHEFTFGPRNISRNNSSTLFSAIDDAFAPFDVAGLVAMARQMHASDGVIIFNDMMDNCQVNKRTLRALATKLEPEPNILYNAEAGCKGHVVHNFICSEVEEDKIVGHSHVVGSKE